VRVAVALPVREVVGEGCGTVLAEQAVIHADSVRDTAARVALAFRPVVGIGALLSPRSWNR
jgi:hypothetical protein